MPIIIADDDQDTVASQAILLREFGFSVIECVNSNRVISLVEEHRPRVVILDLAMPGRHGCDIAKQLNENPALRPKLLIAVTGFGDDVARKETYQAGFDYHIVKPVEQQALIALLKSVLQQPAEREAVE